MPIALPMSPGVLLLVPVLLTCLGVLDVHVSPNAMSGGDCGNTKRKNGAMECPNIGVRRDTYDTVVKSEKGEKSRAVRSYADVTREDVQTPLGKNRLIIS